MVTWLLEAAVYALIASVVLVVNRHRSRTRCAGAALLLFSLASSATFFALRGPDLFFLRVIREGVFITPVATIFAYMYFVGDACRPYRWAVAICAFDVAFCAGILLYGSNSDHIRSAFGWIININFIGMCACIASPGLRDAYRDWIADIERVRRLDSSAPDFDWAVRTLERVRDK